MPDEIEDIINLVCQFWEVPKHRLVGRQRSQEIVTPRQAAYLLLYDFTELRIADIAEYFDRDDSTVSYGKKAIVNYLAANPEDKRKFHQVRTILEMESELTGRE